MKNDRIEEVKKILEEDKKTISNINELNDLKVKYLGKKGLISELNSLIKDIPNEEKKTFGQSVNELRAIFNNYYEEKKNIFEEELLNKRLEKETIDITLPATKTKRGSKHPVNRMIEKIEDLFVSMGYDVMTGPELETDEFCFERLNLPKGHPARDMQDSFYITDEYLLRTQTSAVQARTLLANKDDPKPIREIVPGKTYRKEDDATHSHQFCQCEGLVIDRKENHVSLADLKGTLEVFVKEVIGDNLDLRFRPSYFPFTEPSYEVDVSCFKCGGKGCPLCKDTGWIEILGAGIVHPNVLRMNGYDPEEWGGFAFGPGLERLTMFRYGIPDMRYLYTNDIRFLKEFDRKDDCDAIK